MHLAIMNWRDIHHPAAGGAEVVTYEAARRWVAQGHRVTWVAAAFPGGAEDEIIDGIRIIRRGRQSTIHWWAWRYYRQELRGRVDVVIDQINTIPFFAPLYVRECSIVLVHQLAREVWWYEAGFPINLIGYLAEPLYWQLYRQSPALVGADSTEQDLRRLGLSRILRFTYGLGINPLPTTPSSKGDPPLVLYVGRLVPSKRVLDIVRAVAYARERVPDIRLMIAGAGDSRYIRQLEKAIAALELEACVSLMGHVSHQTKLHLMEQAHLLALASVREGWGLVVVEANAVGTPAVVYDVPGLRDSVQHNQTGLVCNRNTPEVLGSYIADLLEDRIRLAALSEAAWRYSQQFSWERMADEMFRGILSVCQTDHW